MTSVTGMTAQEVANTITGHDLGRIKAQFGKPWTGLDALEREYALAFVHFRHTSGHDVADVELHRRALNLTIGELEGKGTFFEPDEPPDVNPDAPETAAGKESSPPA